MTLTKALEILERELFFEQELSSKDIKPQVWTETDAMGIEARQRFGFFGNISEKRVEILEDGFVFPNLLKELKKRMPNGMKERPAKIIWPLDRSIEDDLNWSPLAPIFIHDSEPGTRAQRKEERRIRLLQEGRQHADW